MLKLQHADPLSNFAFNFNLGRYNEGAGRYGDNRGRRGGGGGAARDD
jgi:hypothetical protein